MRADPPSEADGRVERTEGVVRVVGKEGWILYSSLDTLTAPAAVETQTAFFRARRMKVEWKLFGHDRPPELPQLLARAGYVAEPSETLMVFDLEDGLPVGPDVPGVQVAAVTDGNGLAAAVAVSQGAFGPHDGWATDDFASRLSDPSLTILVAYADGRPICSGRLEMPVGRSFASLWGGGTVPDWRKRGVYQLLTARRAEIARGRGYRFLTVDALPTSRPILERLGFVPLTEMTGWVLDPAPG